MVPVLLLITSPWLHPVEKLQQLALGVHGLGGWGPLAFVFLYASAILAGLPVWGLALGAGAFFGAAPGFLAVWGGELLGSSLCFAWGRWIGAGTLRPRGGGMAVGLTRLVPFLPFNLINYGWGLTPVPYSRFLLGTALGVVPGTALSVVGADLVARTLTGAGLSLPLLGLTLGLLVMLGVLVTVARRRLAELSAAR